MSRYEEIAVRELRSWQKQMLRRPTLINRMSKGMQTKINSYIPDKVHQVITATIRQMTRAVLFGAGYFTKEPAKHSYIESAEEAVLRIVNRYKHTAAAEGGITGAGGILLAFADFPILLGMKLKMLFEIATTYGYSVSDYKERVFLLHIFQLAFSSHEHRRNVFLQMKNWKEQSQKLPDDINQFEWRNFQQEYRDYIDLAKMAQMIPGIGAVVGFVVNYKLVRKLGETAMNAYRMRWEEEGKLVGLMNR